jgi:hypothetical protein
MNDISTFILHFQYTTKQSKYQKWYLSICSKGAQRGYNRKQLNKDFGYVEAHHIIPRSVDKKFEKTKSNIVFLTAREHFICHFLLCKIYKGTDKYFSMLSAFGKMSNNAPSMNSKRYINSHLFEHFRKNVSTLMKTIRSNKVRVKKDGITKEIPKEELDNYMRCGWVKGAASTDSARQSRVNANKERAGFVWMHFPGADKAFQVVKSEVELYLQQGAKKGRVFSKIALDNMKSTHNKSRGVCVTDGVQTKKVSHPEAEELIKNGWRCGRHYIQKNRGGFARPNTRFFNDGIKNYRLLPEEAAACNLIPGRLKNHPVGLEDI